MTGRTVLFGATGHTGKRTAEAMVGRGLRPVLAGRNPDKLTALAQRLGGLPTVVADTENIGSVRRLIDSGDVLVSTVGPFSRLGEPALAAAVDVGAIYLDSTGEPPFIRRVFEEFGPRAVRSGARLITAFGHDYVPGNLVGALAVRLAGGSAYRVEIAYYITGIGRTQAFSRGTFASFVEVAGEPGFTWRDGIREEPTGIRMRTFSVGGKDRPAVSIGSAEHFALPRLHPELREVDVYLGWFGPATRVLHLAARLAPGPRRGRPLLRRMGKLLTNRVAEEPDAAALDRVTAHFVGVAYDADATPLAEVRLVAANPYRLTAALLAWGAARAVTHGVCGTGALGPVEAFGLDVLRSVAPELGLRRG